MTMDSPVLIPGMPVSPEAGAGLLLRQYQEAQARVAVRAATGIVGLWNRFIMPARFSDSWARLDPLIRGIIATHYEATAASAAQFYGHARIGAGFSPVPVPGVTLDNAYLGRVVGAMGPGQFFHFLKEAEAPQASEMARDALRGAGTRLVLMGGRDTITGAATADPVARGWERVITPGACSFCAMLAGRGAVYKESTADFRAHDHCHCVARPVFRGQESINGPLSDEWARATKGTGGAAARAAWDKYWSSRGNANAEAEGEPKAPGPGNVSVEHQRERQPALPH